MMVPTMTATMATERTMVCGTCRFYEDGDCHRYPPQLVSPNQLSWYPDVGPEDWCGEWQSLLTRPADVE